MGLLAQKGAMMSASVRYVVGSAVTLLLTVSPSVAQTDYQLIDAVKSQDEATVRLLINQQSDINAVSYTHLTLPTKA